MTKDTQAAPQKEEKPLEPIVFYCKDCKESVEANRKGKSLTFTCPTCNKANISIGTKSSIENYYNIK